MSKICSPLNGKIKELELVDDVAFSNKMLGDGIVIIPSTGELFAPIDAKISMLFPTKHAIGLITDEGIELLIHIGIDTVNLNGDGFSSFVKENDQVKKGDKLISFDIVKMQEKGYDIDTMIIITNTDNYEKIHKCEADEIIVGDELLEIM